MEFIEKLKKSAARNKKLVADVKGGMSLGQAARKYGVSRERVRQIVERAKSEHKWGLK